MHVEKHNFSLTNTADSNSAIYNLQFCLQSLWSGNSYFFEPMYLLYLLCMLLTLPYCRVSKKNVITFGEWYWLMRTFLSHTEATGGWSLKIKTKERVGKSKQGGTISTTDNGIHSVVSQNMTGEITKNKTKTRGRGVSYKVKQRSTTENDGSSGNRGNEKERRNER